MDQRDAIAWVMIGGAFYMAHQSKVTHILAIGLAGFTILKTPTVVVREYGRDTALKNHHKTEKKTMPGISSLHPKNLMNKFRKEKEDVDEQKV